MQSGPIHLCPSQEVRSRDTSHLAGFTLASIDPSDRRGTMLQSVGRINQPRARHDGIDECRWVWAMVDDGWLRWLRWLAERDKIRTLRGWCESGAPSRQKKRGSRTTRSSGGRPLFGLLFLHSHHRAGQAGELCVDFCRKKKDRGAESRSVAYTRIHPAQPTHARLGS